MRVIVSLSGEALPEGNAMQDEMKLPRLTDEAERRRLKAATDQAVKLSGGVEFEPRTRVKKAALSKYGSGNEPDHFIPLDVAIELDRHNGAPLVIAAAAGMLGYRLIPAAEMEAAELALADAQAIAKESGDVVNLILSLLTSGRSLDAADRRDVLREVTEAKAALYRLAAKVGAA